MPGQFTAAVESKIVFIYANRNTANETQFDYITKDTPLKLKKIMKTLLAWHLNCFVNFQNQTQLHWVSDIQTLPA